MAWPDGHRPSDFLGPTEYTKRSVSTLVARLPQPPASAEEAERLGATLRRLWAVCWAVPAFRTRRFSKAWRVVR